MASQLGENGLIYFKGDAFPLANEWSLDVTQEKIEAPKTFVCPDSASGSWVTRAGGFFSASGSVSCLYEATDTAHIDYVLADSSEEMLLYPNCDTSTQYWKGDAWLECSMTTPVDGYVTVDYSFDSTGAWTWES